MTSKIIFIGTIAAVTAAILVVGAVAAIGRNNIASATTFQEDKPDFASDYCIVTPFATANLSEEALADLDCNMQAWLDNKGNSLKYQIQITGMELVDTDGNVQDDVIQLHIHKRTGGTDANPTGPHQLNVFRAPNFDDSDVVIKPVQGVITGIWDDGDENLSYGEPDNSHKLSENIGLLCDGQIFAAAHGDAEDVPGHKAPYLKMVLEPTADGDKACKKLGFN